VRRRWLLATAGACLVGGTSALAVAGRSPTIEVAGSRVGVHPPRSGEHLVLVANPPVRGRDPQDVSYLLDELRDRGLGVVELPVGPPTGESIKELVRDDVGALGHEESTTGVRFALLAIGHAAQGTWNIIADPPLDSSPASRSASRAWRALMSVPGGAVASLSLNLAADISATDTHHLVHERMTTAHVVHQVIEYGRTGPGALDEQAPDFDAPTTHDVELRTADWLQHRDGYSDQNIENPHQH